MASEGDFKDSATEIDFQEIGKGGKVGQEPTERLVTIFAL